MFEIKIDPGAITTSRLRAISSFLNTLADINDKEEKEYEDRHPRVVLVHKGNTHEYDIPKSNEAEVISVPAPYVIKEDIGDIISRTPEVESQLARLVDPTDEAPIGVRASLFDTEEDLNIVPLGTPQTNILLDAAGLPWDERIHASTKTKTADGCWRIKRGCDPELVMHVMDELRATMSAPLVSDVTPVALPSSVVPPPPSGIPTFATFITMMTGAIAHKKIELSQVIELVKGLGVPAIPLLSARLDLVPEAVRQLEKLIAIGA